MSDRLSRYELYAVSGSRYCYRDTDVLRNKLNLRDRATLALVERDLVSARQNQLLLTPISGKFSPAHLCRIHRYLFGDIYPFAGRYRYEDIAKGATRFLSYREIPGKLAFLLHELQTEQYLVGSELDALAKRASFYFAELNYIHPFREGNGRAIREFMRLLFLKNGYAVDWGAVPVDTFLDAMIESVYDPQPLASVLMHCLSQRPAAVTV